MSPHEFLPGETLRAAGASGTVLDALLAYTANPFDRSRLDATRLPLADEPHLDAWDDYAREAREEGVVRALSRRLVQLRFPIEAGISLQERYRAATRRGAAPDDEPGGLGLADPEGVSLDLHPTLAGRIPILTCRHRDDFVALVRACSCRNEPEPVPVSMGACIVAGLNNWDRVGRFRRRLEEERGSTLDDVEWNDAFRSLVPQKTLYQDRFIILSREPYSGIEAASGGDPLGSLSEEAWRERSVVIRREHECLHYFTLRVYGVMRNNLFDEFIADFAGLGAAFGRYDAGLFLRFLGLEAYPAYRSGGRFENYLEAPPVPPEAIPALRTLVVSAARNVERAAAGADLSDPAVRARFVVALCGSTLVELASEDGAVRVRDRVRLAACG